MNNYTKLFLTVSDDSKDVPLLDPKVMKQTSDALEVDNRLVSKFGEGKKVKANETKLKNDKMCLNKPNKRDMVNTFVKSEIRKKSKNDIVDPPDSYENSERKMEQYKENENKNMDNTPENNIKHEKSMTVNDDSQKSSRKNDPAKELTHNALMQNVKRKVKSFSAPILNKIRVSVAAQDNTSVSETAKFLTQNGAADLTRTRNQCDINNEMELKLDFDATVDIASSQRSNTSSLDFELEM